MNSVIHDPGKLWKIKQVLFPEVIAELHTHFAGIGVRYMPIKGAYLIITGLASKLSGRTMCDIDIMVTAHDYSRVCKTLEESGKAELLHVSWPFENQYLLHTCAGDCILEVMHLINSPLRYLLSPEDIFTRATAHPRYPYLLIPCAEDALAIHLCHQMAHIGYGFDWMMLDEIGVIIGSKKDFDWDLFWNIAKKSGARSFCLMLLHLYRDRKKAEITLPRLPLYPMVCTLMIKRGIYPMLSFHGRRILLEIPFARKRVSLLAHGIIKKQHSSRIARQIKT